MQYKKDKDMLTRGDSGPQKSCMRLSLSLKEKLDSFIQGNGVSVNPGRNKNWSGKVLTLNTIIDMNVKVTLEE